jgi:hypothetical protein
MDSIINFFFDPDGLGRKDSMGQAGSTRLRLVSYAMPGRAGLMALVKYAALFFEI